MTLDWKTVMDGDRGEEETTGERKESAIVHYSFTIWLFFSLGLRCSHFPLASSPILVLILSFAVCQFVKAPRHYCQKITLQCQYKSHTHNIALYTGAHTHTCRPFVCWKRDFFFHDWVLTLSSELVPLESWVRQISSVNWSLWFSRQTLLAHSLSPCTSDRVIVTLLFWCEYKFVAESVLTNTITICAS